MRIFHRHPAFVILCLALAAVLSWQSSPRNDLKQRWAEAPLHVKNLMAHGWVEQHALEGWSREKVMETLGSPDDSSANLSYSLGVQRDSSFPIDPEFLVIHFDKNDRVTSAEITHP